MSVERYPSNDTARRARSIRTLRPYGKPPGYQKDFTPRDKRGRPLKDREGIRKPKQIPKELPKAAKQFAHKLLSKRMQALVEFAPEVISGLNALDHWSDNWWKDTVVSTPGEVMLDPETWERVDCTTSSGVETFYVENRGHTGLCKVVADWAIDSSGGPIQPGQTTTRTLAGIRNYIDVNGYSNNKVEAHFQPKAGTSSPWPTLIETAPSVQVIPQASSELTWEFPLEWPWPNTWADAVAIPGSQPDGSPEPEKTPGRKDAQAPTVPVPFLPGLAVVLVPVTGVVPVPRTQVITVPPKLDAPVKVGTLPPPNTISRPPKGRRVKERKLTLMAAAPMAWAIINFGTEAMDFLGVLHDALPEDLRAKKKSGWSKPKAHEMAEAVYRHFDKIDLATAVENYVNEWIEDQWFGRSGLAGKKLNQMTGSSTGADRALTQGGAGPGEAPEVHLDVHTGEWEVTTPWGNFSGTMTSTKVDSEWNW